MYPLRLRPVRTLLIVLLALLLSTACDKLPRNGALDGQWQLVRLNHTDVTAQRIYWAVQLDLIQLRSPIVAPSTSVAYSGGVTLRFTHRTDSLWIETGFLMDRDRGLFCRASSFERTLGARTWSSCIGISQMVTPTRARARSAIFRFLPSPLHQTQKMHCASTTSE